jgi:hypothetical protein
MITAIVAQRRSGEAGSDGKIKALLPVVGFCSSDQRVMAFSVRRVCWRFMKIRQSYQCRLRHPALLSGGSLSAKAGRQGKSLAVQPAYVVGMVEVFSDLPMRPCQPFLPER